MRSRKRHWEEGYHSDRIMNKLKAHLAGKRVMLTIENPNKNAIERWEWDLNNLAHSNLEDYFQTIN